MAQFLKVEDGWTRYQLVAVLEGGPFDADDEVVVAARTWLADAALGGDAALGTAESIDA